MAIKGTTTDILLDTPTPDMVQDYIASMLRELSDMARTSGLLHLSSVLQVSLLAVSTGSKIPD